MHQSTFLLTEKRFSINLTIRRKSRCNFIFKNDYYFLPSEHIMNYVKIEYYSATQTKKYYRELDTTWQWIAQHNSEGTKQVVNNNSWNEANSLVQTWRSEKLFLSSSGSSLNWECWMLTWCVMGRGSKQIHAEIMCKYHFILLMSTNKFYNS